jgi:uncharacterized protein
LLLLALLAEPAAAELPAPVLRARVADGADLLPAAAEARLESALARFEAETSHQIAVLTVPGLEGEAIEPFALRVAERAELGQRGLDNGILLVVAAKERRARIEVGYGLEGAIPDAVAKRVLEDVVFPRFRAGDFAGGIEAGVDALMRAARGEVVPADRRPPAEPERDPLSALFFAVLVSTLAVLPLRRSLPRRKRRLGAPFLSGTISGVLTWGLLASLAWAGLGFVLGFLLAALLSLSGGPGARLGRRGGGFGFPAGGRHGGFGGGGFSGGGGGFGGGGASGSW